jgi:hypothetical protein
MTGAAQLTGSIIFISLIQFAALGDSVRRRLESMVAKLGEPGATAL